MKILNTLILITLFSYLPIQTYAWGATGHKLVAKIAYSQLPKAVKDSLVVYLGQTTIEEASVWMDEIKSDASNDSLRPMHYINLEKGEEYNPDSTDNIIGELNRVISELKERNKYTKEHVEVDLKILIHLIGDLHQPMHNGYASDRGGNSVQVFFAASSSNLHRVWDSDIIDNYILHEPTDWANTADFSKEQMAEIKHVDLLKWMKESRSYLSSAYDFKGQDINGKYINRNKNIIEDQLLFGGLRLGKLLRDIFRS